MEDNFKFIFIINPAAGKSKVVSLKEEIEKKFAGTNYIYKIEFTQRPMHAMEIAKEYSEKYGDKALLFACGGDGTVNEVANGIVGSKSTMSILPMGTGNDFIKSIFTKRKYKDILKNIFDYEIRDIDYALLNGRVFLNVTSLGFDSVIAQKAKEIVRKTKMLGSFSYLFAILFCLFTKNYFEMKCEFSGDDKEEIKISNDTITTSFTLVAFANGKSYGGIFNPSPNSILDDGYLDMCLADRLSIPKILALVPKYIRGTHLSNKNVHFYKIKKAKIKAVNEKLLVNCDGESLFEDKVEISIVNRGIKIACY